MSDIGIRDAKRSLRKIMAKKLATVSDEEVKQQTESVTGKITTASYYQTAQRISVFVSTEGEIRTDAIIRHALQNGKHVFVPWFEKGNPTMQMLELKGVEDFDALRPTLWGIRQFEQIGGRKSYRDVGPLDLVLAPGVAFTTTGKRLGHGKGFYDKFFAEHLSVFGKMPTKVALALNEQILDDVPVDTTDILIDDIVFSQK